MEYNNELPAIKSPDPRCSKGQFALFTLIILGLLGYLLLTVVTVRFVRTYKTRNKWMLFFFILLNIALILRIIFFVDTFVNFWHNGKPLKRGPFGFLIFFGNLGFAGGAVFNMFNWIHLVMLLNQYLSYIKEKIPLLKLRIWCSIVILLISIGFIGDFALTCSATDETYSDIDKVTRAIRSVVFLTLSTAFIIVGYNLDKRFKIVLKKHHVVTRLRLIVLTVLISLPLLSRGLFNIFWIVFDLRDILILASVKANDFRFPTYMLIYYPLGDLLPMGAQILSVRIAIIHFDKEFLK